MRRPGSPPWISSLDLLPGSPPWISSVCPLQESPASELMHQDMQLGGRLLPPACTQLHRHPTHTHTHIHTHTHFPHTLQVGPPDWGVISYAFAQKHTGTICLSVQPVECVCVCVSLHVCEGSVQHLYLHLYEQIPVGRAAEEHTSCLTYILSWAVCLYTHTHTRAHTHTHNFLILLSFSRGSPQHYCSILGGV